MTPEDIIFKIGRLDHFKKNMLSQKISDPKINIIYKSRWGARLFNYKIKIIQQARKEWERNNTLMILEKYNTWLLKEGYTDTDIMFEFDVNEFLDTLKDEANP